jgi:hypothetical protein
MKVPSMAVSFGVSRKGTAVRWLGVQDLRRAWRRSVSKIMIGYQLLTMSKEMSIWDL